MPRSEYSCNFAIMSDFDARLYTSTIYNRKDKNNVLTAYSLPIESQIVFDDAVAFLNGNGVDPLHTFETRLSKSFTGETWDTSINNLDHIEIIRNNGQSIDVYSTSQSPVLYGTESLMTTYANGEIILNHDWKRGWRGVYSDGVFQIYQDLTKNAVFPHHKVIQSLPSYMNERQGNNYYCLEWTENRFYTGSTITTPAVYWILDDDGHVRQYVDLNLNPYAKDFSWGDINFRNRLGFNGLETWVQDTNGTYLWYLKANNPMPGVLIPTRPLEDHHLKFERPSNAKRKGDGSYTSNFLGNFVTSVLSFHLDAYADSKNDYRHYTDTCGDYFYIGAKVSLYQDWGDTRLALISSQVSDIRPAYDNLYTSENNGSFGVIRGFLTNISNDLPYPQSIRRRVPVTLEISHA